MSRFGVIAIIGYLGLVTALGGGLMVARRSAIQRFASPEAQQAWDDWRSRTDPQRQEQENLPVRRRAPRSPEPPMLVLLRDHFAVCMVSSITLTSVLYWTLALFVRGSMSGPEHRVENSRHES